MSDTEQLDEGRIQTTEDGRKLYPPEMIAKLFGVSVRRVQQLTQEGIISTIKPKGGRRGYELVPAVQNYIKHLKDKAKGRAATEEEEKLKNTKIQVEIDLKKSQLELHQLRTDIANGKYLKIEDVKLDYQRFFTQFKKFAQAVPSRLIMQIAGYIEPVEARALEKSMSQEVSTMLRTFVVAGNNGGGKK